MCDCENQNCGCNDECVPCAPVNCIEQAVNDALAQEKETLEGYVEDAKESAETASQAATDASGFRDEAKGYRDQAEVAANTATNAVPIITDAVNTIQDTADAIKEMGENLEDQIKNYLDDVSFLPWVYNNGIANGGETSVVINVDGGTALGVASVYVNGNRQHENLGYTFESTTQTLTLADALEQGDELVAFVSTETASPNASDIDNYRHVAWLYRNGSATGGETKLTPPYTFKLVPAIYHNGARKVVGLHYQPQADNTIDLKFLVSPGDIIQVILGGTPDEFYAQADAIFTTLAQDDGAYKIGLNGSTVGSVLDGLRGYSVERVLGNKVGFANWPQGKMCAHNDRIHMGFNFGRAHGGLSLHAYVTSTEDGKNFNPPALVAAPTATEEATWWGLMSLGTKMVGIVRFRYGGAGETAPMRNVIYESNASGTVWTAVREITYKTPPFNGVSNDISLVQGGIALSSGKIAFTYQDGVGHIGVIVLDPANNYDWEIIELRNPTNNSVDGLGAAAIQVELNMVRRTDTDQILIVSRTQRGDIEKPLIWVANGDFTSVSQPVQTDIPVNVNPVTPIISVDASKVMFFYSERYNRVAKKAGLYMAEVPLEEAFALNWNNAKHTYLMQLSGGPTNVGGIAGVQHAVKFQDKIYVGVATKVNNSNDGSDLLFLTMDFGSKPAIAPSSGSLQGAAPNQNIEIGLNSLGDYAARIRMNGRSVMSFNGTEYSFGPINGNLGYSAWALYNGHTRPAILVEASTGNAEGQRGRTLFQQRPTFNQMTTFDADMYLTDNKTLHMGNKTRIRIGGSPTNIGANFLYYDGDTKELQLGTTSGATGYTIKFMSAVAQGYIFARSTETTGAAVNFTLQDSDGKATTITAGGSYGTLRITNRLGVEALRIAENNSTQFSGGVAVGNALIADLPNLGGTMGMQVYLRDGKKKFEAEASPPVNGTGCLAYYDGSVWRYVRDDSVVS